MNEKSRGYKIIIKWLAIVVFCIIELYFIHQRTCKYTYQKTAITSIIFQESYTCRVYVKTFDPRSLTM